MLEDLNNEQEQPEKPSLMEQEAIEETQLEETHVDDGSVREVPDIEEDIMGPPLPTDREIASEKEQTDKQKQEQKDYFIQNAIVDKLPTGAKIGLNIVGFVPEAAEDIYNTGVDLVNGISEMFGGATDIDHVEKTKPYMPDDALSETSREIGQLLMGYVGIMSRISGFKRIASGGSVDMAAGMMAEFVFTNPENEAMVLSGLRHIPGVGPVVSDYLAAPEHSGPLEKRMHNAIFGAVDGYIAGHLFKLVKMIGKVKWVQQATDRAGKAAGDIKDAAKEGWEAGKAKPSDAVEAPAIAEIDTPLHQGGKVSDEMTEGDTGTLADLLQRDKADPSSLSELERKRLDKLSKDFKEENKELLSMKVEGVDEARHDELTGKWLDESLTDDEFIEFEKLNGASKEEGAERLARWKEDDKMGELYKKWSADESSLSELELKRLDKWREDKPWYQESLKKDDSLDVEKMWKEDPESMSASNIRDAEEKKNWFEIGDSEFTDEQVKLINKLDRDTPGNLEELNAKWKKDPDSLSKEERLNLGILKKLFKKENPAGLKVVRTREELQRMLSEEPENLTKEEFIDVTGAHDGVYSGEAGEKLLDNNVKLTARSVKEGGGESNSLDFRTKDGKKVFINVMNLDGPEDLRKIITQIVAQNPEVFGRYKITDAEKIAMAADLKKTPKELAEWVREDGLREGEWLAARFLQANAAEGFVAATHRYNSGEMPKEAYAYLMQRTELLMSKTLEMGNLASGILHEGTVNVTSSSQREYISRFNSVMKSHGDSIDGVAKAITSGGFARQDIRTAFADEVIMPIATRLSQIRYSNMLSSPYTHGKNIKDAAFNVMRRPPETLLAATVSAAIEGPITHAKNIKDAAFSAARNPDESLLSATISAIRNGPIKDPGFQAVHFAEATAEYNGMIQGFTEAVILTARNMRGHKMPKHNIKGESLEPRAFMGVREGQDKMAQFRIGPTAANPKSMMGKGVKFLDDMVFESSWGGALRYPEINKITSKTTIPYLPTWKKTTLSNMLDAPGNLLVAEDNFFKHMNARMTLAKEAKLSRIEFTKELRKNLADRPPGFDEVDSVKWEDVELLAAEHELEVLHSPSPSILKKMYKDAEYHTYTRPITNKTNEPWVNYVKGMADTPMGRIVWPFSRVGLNTLSYKAERTPVLRRLLKMSREEMASPDNRIRSKAIAKIHFTSTIMTAVGVVLHQNDSITGRGPRDPKKWTPYTQMNMEPGKIKIPGTDKWIDYDLRSPQGAILASVADMAMLTELVNGDEAILADVGNSLLHIITQTYNPEHLTEIAGTIFEAINNQDADAMDKLIRVASDTALAYTPIPIPQGAARWANRTFTEGGEFKRETFDPNSVIDTFWNKIFNIYMPDKLPKKRNILGVPMTYKIGLGPSIKGPLGAGVELNDFVIQELGRLSGALDPISPPIRHKDEESGKTGYIANPHINIQMPARVASKSIGSGITPITYKLTPSEYERLVLYSAGIFEGDKVEKYSLRNTLFDIMNSDNYKSMGLREQGQAVKKIISYYRTMGTKMFETQGDVASLIKSYSKDLRSQYKKRSTRNSGSPSRMHMRSKTKRAPKRKKY